MGVGNDINVEKEILLRLPGCKLYGADPVLASGQIYSSVGKFFNLAVGADSGNRMAIVLRNSTYKKENVAHVGLVDFLTKFVKITTVDLMILDVEGTEYEILPLLSQGGQLDAAGISLCQISAELHGPIDQYGLNMSSWETLVRNFLLKSDFIPLWTPEPYNHHRMFLINWKNPICITKFYSNLC